MHTRRVDDIILTINLAKYTFGRVDRVLLSTDMKIVSVVF